MQPVIRHARHEDVPALAGLLLELFSIEADFSPDRERQEAGLTLLLGRDDAAVFAAERRGEVVGMCSVQTLVSTAEGGPVGLVEDVVVKDGHRGMGIGSLLLDAACRWAQERGLSRLQLLADRDNSTAAVFYERRGWESTSLVCLRKPVRR